MTNEQEKQSNEEKPPKKRKGKPRRRGSGSILQRKDRKGKQWVAQILLENGRTRQRYFNTEAEADEALTEMLYEQKRGMLATGLKQTVKQYLEHWLENVQKKLIRESTYIEYRKLLNNHILPELGQTRLQSLTIQKVEAFYTRKLNGGLSASTIRIMHAILHQSLAHAVRTNVIARNVCDTAKPPRKKLHEIQPLTEEQAQILLAAVKGHRLEALFTVALVTGMREGELLALHWSDINVEGRYLQVRRTVRRIPGQGFKEGEPKTASSRRRIALSPFLVGVLQQHRIRQVEAKLKAGPAWEEHDLVFCNLYGKVMETGNLTARFHKLLRDGGLPRLRFHDLRHSAATLLLAMGIPAKVVQELLGHSQITTTLGVYGHVLPGQQQRAIEKMSELFDQHASGDEQEHAT